jgi:dTDP-glucose pyrophosphorylase
MKHLLLTDNTTLDDAIKMLDANGSGFLAIVDKSNKLIGIITDGDIRRAILTKQLDLVSVINYNPITANSEQSRIKIKQQLRKLHRRHMPVVNSSGELVEVVILDDFEITLKENWVTIMAGGLGSRLGEMTRETPKPMLKVGDRPILHSIIDNFKQQGFYRFILCVNYKSHVIENYFGDGRGLDVEIVYTKEEKRLGTAGALSLIKFPINHPFFVVNGDVLTTVNYEDFLDFHTIQKSEATMCVKKFSFDIPYATINFDERHSIIGLQEKPSYEYYVNTGMYILNPSVLSNIPENTFYDMPTLFDEMLQKKTTTKVFKIDEYWLDIGRPDDFDKAKLIYNSKKGE